jgi:hypothetical protein
MEPGFAPLNFLQRYGRAARGHHQGQVWVRIDAAMEQRNPWLRRLQHWLKTHADSVVGIADLTNVLARDTKTRFKPVDENANNPHFGSLNNRAAYSAGLYWNVLLEHPSNKGPRREHLRACQPPTAGMIFALLKQVGELCDDPYFCAPAKTWLTKFKQAAHTLRDIGQRLRVRDERGRTLSVDLNWLRRETDLLDTCPSVVGEDGDEELLIQGRLEESLRDQHRYVAKKRSVHFPHTQYTAALDDKGFLPDAWRRELHSDPNAPWDTYPQALAAAEKLVLCTGLVVDTDDDAISLEPSSGVY